MKTSTREREALAGLLRETYWAKENIKIGSGWQKQVMVRIREMGSLTPASPPFLSMFGPFVWRLAPVTCLVSLGLAGLSMALDLVFGYDLVQLLMSTLEEFTFIRVFGF